MKSIHRRTLVLNSDFSPLGIISWRRAIVLSILNEEDSTKGVSIIETYRDDFIQSTGDRKVPIPAIVRTPNYVRQKRSKLSFSRQNIFLRDKLTCSYCGERYPIDKLTYDHVIPRTEWKRKKMSGTSTNWRNIVTCCRRCNLRKGQKTLKEAGMKLLRQPIEPNPHQFIVGISLLRHTPKEWFPYLTPVYKDILT